MSSVQECRCPEQPEARNDYSVSGETGVEIPFSNLPLLEFHLDDYYYIQGDEVEHSEDVKWGTCQHIERSGITAQWREVSPNFPPTRETEARVGGDYLGTP